MSLFGHRFEHLHSDFYTPVQPTAISNPQWAIFNETLATELGLTEDNVSRAVLLNVFSGKDGLGANPPLAMAYAGHQFGQYVDPLGDGRGLLLGEIDSPSGNMELHLKGAGRTPYSRHGDGRAVLRSSIREYLASEALHALNIPTTRALCITTGDEQVWREQSEQAAMLVRVAKAHVRFGSFEYFHYRNRPERVKELADFCLEHYFPELLNKSGERQYALFFRNVVERTAKLIATWQAYGFAHGVMNTDNMSICGDTFDFGPYGFLDDYNERFICNHSDHTGRYAFNAQPSIGLWNCQALANALSTLVDEQSLVAALQTYEPVLNETYYELMQQKLGLVHKGSEQDQHQTKVLIGELLQILQATGADYSLTLRNLSLVDSNSFPAEVFPEMKEHANFAQWIENYQQLLGKANISHSIRKEKMDCLNPIYILRNYLAQQAIEAAQSANFEPLHRLVRALENPFDENKEFDDFKQRPPQWGKELEISCSS